MKLLKYIILSLCAVVYQAQANLIKIELDNTNLSVGETITASLIADFDDSVDTIDLDILFDTSLFSLNSSNILTDLPNDGFDNIFAFEANPTGAGLTFLSFNNLFSGNLMLASFELTALTEGISSITVQTNELYNFALDESYNFAQITPASASVITQVPEPTHFALFLVGLILAGRLRKQK
ncbi:PEP-CTERM sorting domain-containing protein [Catenovulum sp. 2E275]|uniref:PEP-CTERM sorting domain-containing protein n=1 Tax=Catenovulum sp. 2E275 TaxID=2980497 RepID=UPI0021D3AAB0|nr:PEP-CTERM sorting domain-containing protein [Catenovulum sp. 2E275]MCU4675926.1 PEP-CTERM sorting domain-containing protein [Catenovulum sp. 2E275]